MKRTLLSKGEVKTAVEFIRARTRISPGVGVVLGSGLGAFGDRLTSKEIIPYAEIPGFPLPTVPGHSGRLLIGQLKGSRLAVLQGRCHLYEGFTAAQVTFPIQVLADLGIRVLIVTSAAGSVSNKLSPGGMMLIRDHLNLTGETPLRGVREGDRSVFVDLTSAYDEAMMEVATKIAGEMGIRCGRGVLASVMGPSYETPAEVAMLRSLGADAVCMSTVPEVIMARYLDLRVLGVVLITNRAADDSSALSTSGRGLGEVSGGLAMSGHKRVLEVAMRKSEQFSTLLERVVEALGE